MRRMLDRISPVLLVLVLAGGFVIMSSLPATAELPNDPPEPPNGVRPIAALNVGLSPEFEGFPGWEALLTEADQAYIAAQVAAQLAADEAAAAASFGYRGSSARSASYGSCGGDVGCFLACTRAHESDSAGGYSAVSSGGSYRGAYQFQQSTWDAAVAGAGFDQYAGVPADQVPAEVQDAAAAHLYSASGTSPWGGRC